MKKFPPLLLLLTLCCLPARAQDSKTYVPHGTGAPSVCTLGTVYVDDATGKLYANKLGACQEVTLLTAPGGSSGQVQYNSLGAFAGNSGLTYDGANVGVGLAGTTPPTKFVVGDTASTTPRGLMSWQASGDTSSAHIHMRKSRGSFGSPLTIVSGDILGRVVFGGYEGTNWNESAYIRATSTGTIATNRVPSKLEFFTSTDAAPSVANVALTLNSDQSATFANTVNATTFVGALTGTASGNLTSASALNASNINSGTLGSSQGGTGVNNAGRTLTLNTNSGTFSFGAAGKTVAFNNTLTFSGTDGSTLNIGGGGSLGGMNGWTDGTTRTVAAASTQYNYLISASNAFNGTETNRQNVVPDSFTLSRLYLRTSGAQPNDAAMVCTVRDSTTTTDTALTVTVGANASAGTFSDTSHTATVAAGDLLTLKCVNSSASASAGIFDVRLVMTRN